jgi:hypothetical protein
MGRKKGSKNKIGVTLADLNRVFQPNTVIMIDKELMPHVKAILKSQNIKPTAAQTSTQTSIKVEETEEKLEFQILNLENNQSQI